MLNFFKKPTPWADALRDLCKDPNDWNFDHFRAKYRPSGLQIWIANGAAYLRESDCASCIGNGVFRPSGKEKRICYDILMDCQIRQLSGYAKEQADATN